jgi:hypothetical protein
MTAAEDGGLSATLRCNTKVNSYYSGVIPARFKRESKGQSA